jgi:outer membrane protein TolC
MHMSRIATMALAICGIALSTSSNAQDVTFTKAWELLQQQNNSLAASRANVERYQQLQSAKKSLNLPSISLEANYTRLDDDVTLSGEQLAESITSPVGDIGALLPPTVIGALGSSYSTLAEKDVFTSSIRAIWPVFTGGKINSAQAIAAGQTEEARAQLAMETQARYEDLAKYYFGVVLSKQVLNTYQQVEQGLQQHRDFAVKMENQGQVAKVERLQAEASLAKATVDRKKAERDLDIAVAALTQILNQPVSVNPVSELFINSDPGELNEYVSKTLQDYPGLSILEAKQKQAQGLIKVEKSKYYPDVFVYGNYSLYHDDTLTSQLTPDWFVGVGMSLPLLESSGRSNQVQAAHSTVKQIDYMRAQAMQDLGVLVQKTHLEAEQAIEEVKGLEASISLATENLNLRKKAFTQGLSSSLDVVDAELYLAQIQTQQHVAQYSYLIALNRLLALSNSMQEFRFYEQRPLTLATHS